GNPLRHDENERLGSIPLRLLERVHQRSGPHDEERNQDPPAPAPRSAQHVLRHVHFSGNHLIAFDARAPSEIPRRSSPRSAGAMREPPRPGARTWTDRAGSRSTRRTTASRATTATAPAFRSGTSWPI